MTPEASAQVRPTTQPDPPTGTPVIAADVPPVKGTPKLGVICRTCDDWGTVVAEDEHEQPVAVLPCPDHIATPTPDDH